MFNSDGTIEINENSFVIKDRTQILIVEEWGNNSVRIISSPNHSFERDNKHGIEELKKNKDGNVRIKNEKGILSLKTGDLKVIYINNKLTFYYKEKIILEEYSRKQSDVRRTIGIDSHIPIESSPSSSLNITPREFKFKHESSYSATLRFEGDSQEKIFGLGGYQEESLNKSNGTYELMHRNSQTSIPFYISDKNYGFIWNNASIGEVSFNKNQKIWKGFNTEVIDYIVTSGETPKDIINNFTEMTGRTPKINDKLLGLWQSKLRYQTIDEITEVYRKYLERGISLSVLVIDYFHWTADGDFEFDMRYWDGIDSFAEKLKGTNTSLMVSLWPTVTKESKYYNLYHNLQMIIKAVNNKDDIFDGKEILDFSNPLTVKHVRKLLNKNYRDLGIKLFWADQAEPEMANYNHDEYLVYEGNLEKVGNRYPYHYINTIQDGSEINANPILIRSAWFNSQKYGALAWSGDIDSSFESLRRQIQIGISMGISGISWWTSDIAGFHSGDSNTPYFKELMIRWFQYSVFTPILRMHGDRQPHTQRIGDSGGGLRTSGAPNEIWSFGKDVESILINYIRIRENLKSYIKELFMQSSEYGYPIIRSLFFEFPNDSQTWEETTNYMFGSSLLIAPVVEVAVNEINVYLPKDNNWIEVFSGKEYKGGNIYNIKVALDNIPVFCKKGSKLEREINKIF
ncbi:glycosyl hydrolase family 31 [Ruoffia tabacinasalis]|uniref:Glycosyl hydrolase family 31 n=1 Tax=Ruoffia tabacinasalis TaxID=87458 RepID=A0A5R9DV88_9LACT|nr:TIM-barrel domain-containing protein [Ruoffia tabacinasalis]TLQ39867.1 glycosyl hydrolase family 31 [Ruoffia tabacinasalis]